VTLPRIGDDRGALTVVEGGRHIPFAIERIYFLSDVPTGAQRGGHAHKALQQLFIAVAGAFDLVLHDGTATRRIRLDTPHQALHVGPMIWRELEGFTEGAVCLVLASAPYDEADYYRDFDEYLRAVRPG
jgi:hypothetical protein